MQQLMQSNPVPLLLLQQLMLRLVLAPHPKGAVEEQQQQRGRLLNLRA